MPVTTAFVVLVKLPLKLDWLEAADPPLAPPVGALQLKVVPVGIVPTGLKLKGTPVQVVKFISLAIATGNTLTVTVNPLELQLPGTFGVTKYVAVATEVPVLVNVPLKLLALVAPAPLNTPFIVGVPHEYVVPIGTGVPVGVKLN